MSSSVKDISYLVLEANSTCNLACVTCNRPALVEQGLRNKKNLTRAEFLHLIGQFKDSPVDTIKFEGLSEPMLHPGFAELAALLRESFPKAMVIIATNLQYEMARSPFEATLPSVDMVYLSIDGIGDTYEHARVGARFPKLLRSLAWLRENISPEVRATKLHINFTATENNFRDLPRIYELRDTYGLASVRINLAQNWNEDKLNDNHFGSEMLAALKEHRRDIKGVPGWEYRNCFWPHSAIVVDVFGDVRQCLLNTSQKSLGNLFRQDLVEIFERSPVLNHNRAMLKSNCPPESCRTCDYHHLSGTLRELLGEGGPANRPRTWGANVG